MAVGEKRNTNQISQVSWTDGTAMDVYYWLEHSFQYSKDINCDDELHWIKLSTKACFVPYYSKCQLTSLWDNGVVALSVDWIKKPVWFNDKANSSIKFPSWWTSAWIDVRPNPNYHVTPWVVFQDYFWFWTQDSGGNNMLAAYKIWTNDNPYIVKPSDHMEATDEDISTPIVNPMPMRWVITAILNYNNTRLVVATSWEEAAIWVYYPELDQNSPVTQTTPWSAENWTTWWKKVLTYEAWVTIVWLTCSFEYLKTWCVDEWWNTKVYYYQGNNDLRNTFVYNLVDLTGVRVLRVYSINWIDYYVSSIDWTDGFVNLYKLVWNTPVPLFKTRAWLSPLDVNYKAPYFVWPCWLNAAYSAGKFYIADAYWLFQFTYNPQWFDKWYMKWKLQGKWEDENHQVYWVCENQWWLYVSTEAWCYRMRVIDTGNSWLVLTESDVLRLENSFGWTNNDITDNLRWWFQPKWILISREYEWKEWGTYTKMLDEIRLNFELNLYAGTNWVIDVYVSPNNNWTVTHTFNEANWWYHVMNITGTSLWTRTEKSNLFNCLWNNDGSSFKFDWQTITYAIVITRAAWDNNEDDDRQPANATPIVRQIDVRYHTKDKVNNVYDIN